MKTTFIFDTTIYKVNEDYYTRTLTYKLWKDRYFKFFGTINLVTRVEQKDIEFINKNPMLQKINGKNVVVNPIKDYKNFPDAIINKKKIIFELEKQIINSDFVILRTPAMLSIFAEKICKKNNISYLTELVADPWDIYYYHSKIAGKLVAPYMYRKTKKICKESNSILYVTENYLQKKYPALTNNQVGVSDVIIPDNNNEVLENRKKKISFNKNNNIFKFGIVGNYDFKMKGQEQAIKALVNLAENCILELVGAGDKNYLYQLSKKLGVENRVNFLGTKKSGTEMFNWMDSIDVLLMPSLTEGLPRVMVEGMSRGLPAIGSNVGGIVELIDPNLIYKKGRVEELQKLMQLISCDNKLLLNTAEENFIKAQNFNKFRLDTKRENFYNSIMKGTTTYE